ncbi:MAG: hypothetical protein GC168_16465 [Candidatus Hydrogenedens sp.]|nr:hypothetical protein [Candidatus Hydrogenedens sp.]
MDCPACKNPMMVLEYNGVEADFCDACGGVWLDASELELLFGDRQLADDFMRSDDSGKRERDRQLKCPISGKSMLKGRTAGPEPVTYDYSPYGMWFDRGELESILKHGSTDPGGEDVLAWLRELFPAQEA